MDPDLCAGDSEAPAGTAELRGVREQLWLSAVVILPGLEQICRERNAILTRVLLRKKCTVQEHFNLGRGTGNCDRASRVSVVFLCPLQSKCFVHTLIGL